MTEAEAPKKHNSKVEEASWHQAEQEFLTAYNPADYERPSVTVHMVIFRLWDIDLKVLLVKRRYAPYQGMWALPGGFINMEESLEAAALRELKDEVGVENVYLE